MGRGRGDERERGGGNSALQEHEEMPTAIEEGFIQKRRQRSSLLLGGQNLFESIPR